MVAKTFTFLESPVEKSPDHFVHRPSDADDGSDAVFGEELLGAGAHPTRDDDLDALVGQVARKKARLVPGVGDGDPAHGPTVLDIDQRVLPAMAEVLGD